MKNVFYFPHDYNARNDEKTAALLCENGLFGYGVFWAIVEIMHEDANGNIAYDDKRLARIASSLKTSLAKLKVVLEDCIHKHDLFYVQDGFLCSNRVYRNRQILQSIKDQRSGAGKASAESRARNKQLKEEKAAATETSSTDTQRDSTGVEQPSTNKEIKESKEKEEIKKEREGEDNFSAPAHADVLLADRVQLFRQEVNTYLHTYTQPLLDGFFRYWSEPDQLNTYMKKDLERTWNTTSRLATWHHREARYGTASPPANNPAKPAYDYLAERKALEERTRQFGKDLHL